MAHCLWTEAFTAREAGGIAVLRREDAARLSGVQTCGSVWACPVCMARINEVRRGELVDVLAWAKGERLYPLLMTLTARHGRADKLEDLLQKMKEAKRRLVRHRSYGRIKEVLIGSITATEVTHGSQTGIAPAARKKERHHGWHVHFHVVMFVQAPDEDAAIQQIETLRRAWLSAIEAEGLSGNGAAFDVRTGAQVAEYVTKYGQEGEVKSRQRVKKKGEGTWGLPEEMTMARNKTGKREGRTPMQLLKDAEDDPYSAQLWQVYARAFKGRNQLTWSRGLKAMAEIQVIEDQQAAEPEAYTEAEDTQIALIGRQIWPRVRVRRGEILRAAEGEDPEQAVQHLIASMIQPKPRRARIGPEIAPPDDGEELLEMIEEIEALMRDNVDNPKSGIP